LFLAGFYSPGAVMTIFIDALCHLLSRKYGMGADQAFRWRTGSARTFLAALPA